MHNFHYHIDLLYMIFLSNTFAVITLHIFYTYYSILIFNKALMNESTCLHKLINGFKRIHFHKHYCVCLSSYIHLNTLHKPQYIKWAKEPLSTTAISKLFGSNITLLVLAKCLQKWLLDSGWGTRSAIYGWCSIKMYTGNLYNSINLPR